MVSIGFVRNEYRWSHAQWQSVADLIPADLFSRAQRFWQWTDQQAYIIGKLLLCSMLNLRPQQLHLLYTINGKPHLKGAKDFNISHSGNLVICAVSDHGRVGIDVEKRERININEFRSVFTPDEWISLQKDEKCAVTFFYDYWTKKEAVLKATGTGLLLGLNKVKLSDNSAIVKDESWIVQPIQLPAPYCCHLAMEIDQPVSAAADMTSVVRQYIIIMKCTLYLNNE